MEPSSRHTFKGGSPRASCPPSIETTWICSCCRPCHGQAVVPSFGFGDFSNKTKQRFLRLDVTLGNVLRHVGLGGYWLFLGLVGRILEGGRHPYPVVFVVGFPVWILGDEAHEKAQTSRWNSRIGQLHCWGHSSSDRNHCAHHLAHRKLQHSILKSRRPGLDQGVNGL